MKTLVGFTAFWLAGLFAALAQSNQTSMDLLVPVKYSPEWKPNPSVYRSILSEKPEAPVLTIGHKEYPLQGPLVETFRPPKATAADDFVDGKLRRIPILNLIVPYKMPTPPEGKSKYFRWKGESSQPWASIQQVGAAGCGGADNRIHMRPSGTLISAGF